MGYKVYNFPLLMQRNRGLCIYIKAPSYRDEGWACLKQPERKGSIKYQVAIIDEL